MHRTSILGAYHRIDSDRIQPPEFPAYEMLPAFPNVATHPPIQYIYPAQAVPVAPAASFVYLPPEALPVNGTPAVAPAAMAMPIYPSLSPPTIVAPPMPIVDAFVVPRPSISSVQAYRISSETQAVPGGTPLPRKSVGKQDDDEEKGEHVDPDFAPCRFARVFV